MLASLCSILDRQRFGPGHAVWPVSCYALAEIFSRQVLVDDARITCGLVLSHICGLEHFER